MMGGTGVLLLSSVAGYWVLERSAGHKGELKSVGRVVGWVVIVLSLVGAACRMVCSASGLLGRYCPRGKMACPFFDKAAPASVMTHPETPSEEEK